MAVVVCAALFVLAFLMSKPIGAYQLGGSVCAQNMGVNIKAFPRWTDSVIQCSVCLCDGFCRADLLCGNCSAAAGKKSAENVKTDSGSFRHVFWAVRYSACSVI